MSLRLKALLAVVILVSLVTGSLGYWVSVQWEQGERERIDSDLDVDLADLVRHYEASHRAILGTMVPATQQRLDLRFFVRGSGPDGEPLKIADNFNVFLDEWLERTGCEVGFVAFDTFNLESSREAPMLGSIGDLTLVAFKDSRADGAGPALLAVPELADWLDGSFEGFFDSPDPTSHLLDSGDAVWLAVALPLYKDANGDELSATAVVMKELSEAWIRSGFSDLRNKVNPVKHVIHAPGGIRTSTLDLEEHERACEQEMRSPATTGFEVNLGRGSDLERWIAKVVPATEGSAVRFVALKGLDAELGRLRELLRWLRYVGVGLAAVGVGVAYMLAARVVGRLDVIRNAAARVRQGDFATRIDEKGHDEVSALSHSFNRMTEGLKALGLYTDPVIAKSILEANDSDIHGGTSVVGTVFFSDIAGFATISEDMTPQQLVTQLNEYFELIGSAVKQEGGYLDKFIGDAVMAWWGPPFYENEDGPEASCRAALAVAHALEEFNEVCANTGRPVFRTRIGLAYGPVTVGNLGSATKKNYTVMGDTANLASRLEGVNKVYGTLLLVDGTVAEGAPGIVFREIDAVRVKGKSRPVAVMEPLGPAGIEVAPAVADYAAALELYRGREFSRARQRLEPHVATDPPSAWLHERCARLESDPPGADWEPVTNLETK